jgi:hypothetical protein
VCLRVIALLHEVPITAYSSLLLDMHDNLERLHEAYRIDGARRVFQETTLRYHVNETESGAQTLVKEYAGGNPPDPQRLLDFSGLQRSSVRLDDGERGETSVPVVHSAA